MIKRGSNLEPFREHLLNDSKLNKKQRDTLANYRKANGLLCAGYSIEQTNHVLRNELGLSESHSYKIIREAILLYGDIKQADKSALKWIAWEQLMLASNLARKAGDFKAMITALDKAAKLMDLYNPELPTDPQAFVLKRIVQFSDDDEAYQDGDDDTLDIDSEEVEDAGE